MDVPRKYGLLRAIAVILKLLGVLVLLAGLVGLVLVLVSTGQGGLPPVLRVAAMVILPLLAVVWFVQLFAFGSILSLLVDIEENTRALAAESRA